MDTPREVRMKHRNVVKIFIALALAVTTVTPISAEEGASKTKTIRIGIVIFEGVMTSEVAAPVEVLGCPSDTGPTLHVILIAERDTPVRTNEGLAITPDATFSTISDLDVLIVPSSYNLEASEENEQVIQFVREQGKKVEFLASNCAGAFILGEAGLLDGRKVTTWVGGGTSLQERFPDALVQDGATHRVVVDGNLITSNGLLVTYEASLMLLEKLAGKERAKKVAAGLYIARVHRN